MKLKTFAFLSLSTLVAVFCSASHAQTLSVIYKFTGHTDGGYPAAGVTIRGGSLFGTTNNGGFGGTNGDGVVYQLTPVGSDWAITPVFIFNGTDGSNPQSRVVFGPDQRLYGTTTYGGAHGLGTVFQLTPPLSICKAIVCYWTEKVLHDFQEADGAYPIGGDLVWDKQGNIYGTAGSGGAYGYGAVFELTPSGNGWTESVLHSFSPSEGWGPEGSLVIDVDGNLYGTTSHSGGSNLGNVFKLTYIPGVGWQETVIYSFQDGFDGRAPLGGLVADSAGNLYGAASDGGVLAGGAVFELARTGDNWNFQLLASLYGPEDYCGPNADISIDAAGNLYGTTYCDGDNIRGTVFKVANTPNGWVYSILHQFSGLEGEFPVSNVAVDKDGTLYGTTLRGGSQFNDHGVVWMIKP